MKIVRATRRAALYAQRRDIPIDPVRARFRAVDVYIHHRRPRIGQVAQKLITHRCFVERDGARHDHERAVVPAPQLVDDRGHQAQHTARALEALQRGPILVEPVEQLRVDGVRRLHAVDVLALGNAGGELTLVIAVHVGKRLDRRIA